MQGSGRETDPEAATILSRARLDGYRVPGGGNSDRRLIGRYLYSAAISESLYPLFHVLEVVLRNRLHEAAATAYPVDSDLPNTYDQFPCWLDAVNTPVLPDHQPAVLEAKQGVLKDLGKRYGATKAAERYMWTPGRLVAKLPFSFWVFLLDERYVGANRRPGRLWPQLFAQVFPHHGGDPELSAIRKRLRRMLVVRNRIMHFERIVPYENGDGALNPTALRRDMLQIIGWMAPRAAKAVESLDRLPEITSEAYIRCLRIAAWRL